MSGKPTAQGTLGKTPFAHLLLYASDRALTGTLAIWPEEDAAAGRGQERLFLQGGQVVAVRPMERHQNAYDAVISLFARLDGPYGFYADQNLLGAGEDVLYGAVDTFTALSRGLRAHARDAVMDAVLMKIGARSVRVRESLRVERLELVPRERALVERLQRNKASIDELMREADMPGADIRRLLYLLTLIRGIETAEGRPAVAGLTVDTIPPAPKPDSIPIEPTPRPTPRPAPNPSSSPAPRPSRPSMPSMPSMPAPGASSKSSEAHAHFGSPPSTTTTAQPVPPVPSGLNPTDAARWEQLTSQYERLDQLTHYQLLQVATAASAADINTAYFGLVKRFHPDRLPASLAPMHQCAQLLFERLTEANDTLGNTETRCQYDKAVADGGGTRASERMMRNVLDSALEFQKAEVLMKRRDFAQAMTLLRSALAKNDEDGDYHALHASLLHLMNPVDPAPTDEMLVSLDRALKSNPQSERAHYYKGVVLKRLKRDREALSHFRAAAQLNPRNVDAARELRLATMRRESKPPPPGLLSKLLKGQKDPP